MSPKTVGCILTKSHDPASRALESLKGKTRSAAGELGLGKFQRGA